MAKSKSKVKSLEPLVPSERIEKSILFIRGQKVMLDRDLAELYEVETRVLVQAVKRNIKRFPTDFMFQLRPQEAANLTSQFVMSSSSHGGRRRPPYVFTEQGVAMLSSVLHSERAVLVNVEIMRAFVRLRELLATHADLAKRIEALEAKYDEQFRDVFDAIRQLMEDPSGASPKIEGFTGERKRLLVRAPPGEARRRAPRRSSTRPPR